MTTYQGDKKWLSVAVVAFVEVVVPLAVGIVVGGLLAVAFVSAIGCNALSFALLFYT
jgi:hypothetical protein